MTITTRKDIRPAAAKLAAELGTNARGLCNIVQALRTVDCQDELYDRAFKLAESRRYVSDRQVAPLVRFLVESVMVLRGWEIPA